MSATLNNVLTASRMGCFLRCPRQHFWQCEVGLVKTQVSFALRFGSAWARAMEARWKGEPYKVEDSEGNVVGGALAYAIPADVDLNEYDCAKLSALLAAYYDYYGPIEEEGTFYPERQFKHDLSLAGFTLEGKLDTIGQMKDGQPAIVEGKTTGESLDPDSVYWMRLAFNVQLSQYVIAARKEGWDMSRVFYDVTRKPSIKPKEVANLDSNKLKIVLGLDRQRVLLKAGKNKGEPKQSADASKGEMLLTHVETPDEYCDRLYRDALARPHFYFARREVAVVDDTLRSFERQRVVVAKMILALRDLEEREDEFGKEVFRDPEAWPRNVSSDTCNYCAYRSFCLQNISVNLNHPPEGFEVKPFNPELQYDAYTSETSDASSSAE